MFRTLTQQELFQEAITRFGGADPLDWAFECPRCRDIAMVWEFPAGTRDRAGQECLGRFVSGRGCDWICEGLAAGPWTVITSDGRILYTFALAECATIYDDEPQGVPA